MNKQGRADWVDDILLEAARYIICPVCGCHSDLGIDRARRAPEDPVFPEHTLEMKVRTGCYLFHENPATARLWLLHHNDAAKWHQPPVSDEVPEYYKAPDALPPPPEDFPNYDDLFGEEVPF